MKDKIISGRVWVIRDAKTKTIINNIDTDMIYHNAHLAVTDVAMMGKYSFGNLEGWKDFPEKVKPGDIVVSGENFGAGSSRQHAVDCFRSLGISLIVAKSFGAIYKRNAINSGMPLVSYPNLPDNLESGDEIEIHLESGKIRNMTKNMDLPPAEPFSRVQMDIYQSGDLFEYARSM